MLRTDWAPVLFLLAASTVHAGSSTRIALCYDAELAQHDFASPAMRLTFNGRTAWFLVDTGAGVHTFASWFAAAGLEVVRPQWTRG